MATMQPASCQSMGMRPAKQRVDWFQPVYFAAFLGYLLLLPPQMNPTIGGSSLPPYRLYLIASSAFVLGAFVKGRVRFIWPDLFMLATAGWIALAMFLNSPREEAITASVANVTDVGLAYFFARATITNLRDYHKFLLLLLPGLAIVGLFLVAEAVFHRLFFQELFRSITGLPINYYSSPRYGLMRATGPFPHPILAGIFFTSFLPLYWQSGFKTWVRSAGSLASLAGFFTVSSATLLGLVASSALLAYSWLNKQVALASWSLFLFFAGVLAFVAELGTKSGIFSLFVRFGSLNSASSYNRILIWEYGSATVAKNPWFGIGYADWDRPFWMGDSVDNNWMLMAIRFGAPASVLVGILTLLVVILLIRKSTRSAPAAADCERALVMSIAVFALGLISVAVWLTAQAWYFVLLGMAASLAHAKSGNDSLSPASDKGAADRALR